MVALIIMLVQLCFNIMYYIIYNKRFFNALITHWSLFQKLFKTLANNF